MKISIDLHLTKKEWIIIAIDLAFIAFLLAFDLLTKHFVINSLGYVGAESVFIPKLINFIYCQNTGASFSILSDSTTLLTVFSFILCIAIVVALILFFRKINAIGKWRYPLKISVLMIFAGGLGNLIDRMAFGYVRDFIYYQFIEEIFHYSFPVCNIADVELTLGMVLLVICLLFSNILNEKSKNTTTPKQTSDLEETTKPSEESEQE